MDSQQKVLNMAYSKFDSIAAERILFYVYALRDPRNKEVFYVGKGKGNRWFEHIQEARSDPEGASRKLSRIREIEDSGFEVEAYVIRSGIASEHVAYEVEAAVIHTIKFLEQSGGWLPADLTNLAEVHGSKRGLAHVSVLQSVLNAPPAPPISEKVGLFKIGVLWHPLMSMEDVRQATFGWWPESKVKNARRFAKYAFGVSEGIVRGIYRIDESMWRARGVGDRDWEHDVGGKPRWGFPDCEDAPELNRYLNTSVKHLFKRGDQNSVKFLNCHEPE